VFQEGVAFADRANRKAWIKEKGMVVFQLTSDRYPANNIDVFADAPFDFLKEYDQAHNVEPQPGLRVPIVALDTLIAMKRAAGRDKDCLDIDYLQRIRDQAHEG
jgi:hypothetical protein